MVTKRFWKSAVPGLLGPLALAVCGCEGLSHTENGALVGGGLGAATGAVIAKGMGRNGLPGAAIGGAIGALGGAAIGHAADQSEKKQAQAEVARAQLAMADIVQMAQQHISDQVIVTQIRTSGSVFHLDGQQISYLKVNGVSDSVIIEMQETARRVPRRVYAEAPVERVYVVEQAPPPPPPVAVGIGYHGRW